MGVPDKIQNQLYVIYVTSQHGFKPKSPVKTAVNPMIFVILSSTKPFKITPILLKYSYYVLHITCFTFNQPRSLAAALYQQLHSKSHVKRKKINIIPWPRPKSLFHVHPEWTSVVICCETRPEQGSELQFCHQLRTEPLFQHHSPVYTSCKPALVWPGCFVNTCIWVLLLIRHAHKY